MKCSKKVVAFTLAATMIFGSVIGVLAEEDGREVDTTENKITFISGAEGDPTDPVDPEKPDEPAAPDEDKEVPTGNTGDIRLDLVPQFDFGTQNITVGEKSFYAELPEDEAGVQFPYYAQVTDVSGSGAGWSLNAKMTTEFTSSNTTETHKLNGAEINLSNVTAASQTGTITPSTTNPGTLKFDTVNDSTIVLAVALKNQGMGVSAIRFGNTDKDGGTMTADKSVELTIPAATQIYAEDYSATIKWTLAAIPTP